MTHEIRTDHFLLRPFQTSDAPGFAEAVRESSASLTPWMPWAHAEYSETEALAWVALCDANRASGTAYEFGIFSADDGRFVGGAGLNRIDGANAFCNLGYWVRASAQRQGAASRAVALLARHAFEVLALQRVEIIVAEGNVASYGVAVKAGAQRECLARNRIKLKHGPVAAHVFSLIADAG